MSGSPGPSSSTVSCRKPSSLPVDPHLAAGLERRVDGIADDVDQQLLELIRIGVDLHVVASPTTSTGSRFSSSAIRCASGMIWIGRCCGFGSRASCAYARRKRPSAPDRVSIRFRPSWISAAARHVRHARDHPLDAVRDRLDRRQRVVDLVRQHADDALPRLLLFLAQRAAQVGEHEQLMRLAVAVERRSPQLQPAAVRPERPSISRGVSPVRYCREPQRRRVAPEQRAGRLSEQPLRRRIGEHQPLVHVEREDRDVDRPHHARAAAPSIRPLPFAAAAACRRGR